MDSPAGAAFDEGFGASFALLPPPPPPANPTLRGLFGIEPNNSLLRIANGRAASAVRAEDRAARGGTRFLPIIANAAARIRSEATDLRTQRLRHAHRLELRCPTSGRDECAGF